MKYIIAIVIIIVVFFGFLWIKRGNELPKVRKVVSDFFTAISADNKTVYEPLIHPAFKDIFADFREKLPENFKNITSIADGDGLLKVSTETGTTFEYNTTITYTYKNGQQLGVLVKLTKEEGAWLIYGIQFGE